MAGALSGRSRPARAPKRGGAGPPIRFAFRTALCRNPGVHVVRFDSESAWAEGVAALWCERLRANPRLRMCLPAGLTPRPLYDRIVRAAQRGEVSFRRAEVFLLDEYGGLAPDDPARCVNQLRRFLLDRVPVGRFHRLDPLAPDLDRECRDFEAAIGPGFDLAILGVGLNGHLGMNEPGSAPDSPTRRVELQASSIASSAAYGPRGASPTWGLTVGLKALLGATEVWLLVRGANKAAIVRRVIEGPPEVSVPASWLQTHPNCHVFLDAAAAGEPR